MPIGSFASTATRTYIKGTTLSQCHFHAPSKCLLETADLPCQNAWGAYALGNFRCKQALGDKD
ncbi:hypothetical protein P692DRAFT_20825101 [Suillus brevipes Sb2]|nr:hypothetical protein P692DRAFT_20825101 [Suillus brevipes Sb2]